MQAKIPALKFGIVCRRLSEKIGAQGRNRIVFYAIELAWFLERRFSSVPINVPSVVYRMDFEKLRQRRRTHSRFIEEIYNKRRLQPCSAHFHAPLYLESCLRRQRSQVRILSGAPVYQ